MRIILFLALVVIALHTLPPSAMAEEEKGYMELDRWDLHNNMSSEEVLQYQLSPK